MAALIDEALKANPEVRQMRDSARASKEAISPAGALDDPQAGFEIADLPTDTWSYHTDPMTQKMFELSQKFPFPGKRRLRSEVAAEQFHANDYSYQDKVNEVRAKVLEAYWALSMAYRDYDLTQQNERPGRRWSRWRRPATVWARAGRPTSSRPRWSWAITWTASFSGPRNGIPLADLNALRSKPPHTPIARPQPLKPRPFTLKLDELLAQAKARPQLQALKALIAQQEKSVNLAKKAYFPDFTIGVNYALREDVAGVKQSDMFSGQFMVNLPIWQASKIKPKIREEEAKEEAAKEAHQSAWDQLAAAIKDRVVKLQRLDKQPPSLTRGSFPRPGRPPPPPWPPTRWAPSPLTSSTRARLRNIGREAIRNISTILKITGLNSNGWWGPNSPVARRQDMRYEHAGKVDGPRLVLAALVFSYFSG